MTSSSTSGLLVLTTGPARLRLRFARCSGRITAAAEKAGARRVAAQAHTNLGSAYSVLGEFGSALQHEENAAEIFKQIGDRRDLMIALGEIGVIYDSQDEPRKAILQLRVGLSNRSRSQQRGERLPIGARWRGIPVFRGDVIEVLTHFTIKAASTTIITIQIPSTAAPWRIL